MKAVGRDEGGKNVWGSGGDTLAKKEHNRSARLKELSGGRKNA